MDAEKRARLDRGMSPKVVAVVGAKKAADYSWLRCVRDFTGKAYSVQVDKNEIPGIEEMGFTNLASVKDIPEEVDYVICAVPRNVSPYILRDSIEKKVGVVGMFTSGFAETQTEEGRRMQEVVLGLAREGDLNIVGPNCMGIYNPSVGLRVTATQPAGVEFAGPVGFISQSGTQAIGFSMEAAEHGVGVTKVVSFGNGIVLHAPDYLEYFLEDPDTKYIGCYLEGMPEGRRFFETLRRVTAVKPVVIWKGGITADSARATQSHTASLAIDTKIWESMVRQAGGINVHGMDEMIDMIKAVMYTQPFIGKRLGLIAASGGHSVEIADSFSREGLRVPPLTQESYDQLEPWFNVVGGSFRNPLEGGGNMGDEDNIVKILEILDNDANVDAMVIELGGVSGQRGGPDAATKRAQTLVEWRERSRKPLWAVLGSGMMRATPEIVKTYRDTLRTGNIPLFDNFTRAARALAKFQAYSENRIGAE